MEIGRELKLRRLEEGLTLEVVSKKVGVTANYISLIERGKNKPNNDLLDKFTELYSMNKDHLYEAYGLLPPSIEDELQDETLRKTITAINKDHRLTQEDKTNLYERLHHWHKTIKSRRED